MGLGRMQKLARRLIPTRVWRTPEGMEGIARVGHRAYVGGRWEEIGRLQFDFLVSHGMGPADVLVDVGCGSLRGGVHYVRYLEPGHYLGLDKEAGLIEAGLTAELPAELVAEKQPEFVVSDCFDFAGFSRAATYGIAQSLFSHLAAADIELCLRNLREFMVPGGRLFATFVEKPPRWHNPARSHSHARFGYSRDEMVDFGRRTGFEVTYLGDWGHPRGQVMVEHRVPDAG